MHKAVLLGRVSRGERQQDPENQLAPLRATAARRDVAVAKELAFKLSAWDEDEARQVWKATLEALDATQADGLMIWAVDRMSRGGIYDTFAKIRDLDRRGVAMFSLQEPFLSTADPATKELLLALLAWVAGQESNRKSERLLAKVATKKREAAKLGRRALWGRGRMPIEADVGEFLRLRAEGLSYAKVGERTGFAEATVWRAVRSFNPPPSAEAPVPSAPVPSFSAGGERQEGR